MFSGRSKTPAHGSTREYSLTPADAARLHHPASGIGVAVALAVSQAAYFLIAAAPPLQRAIGLVFAAVTLVAAGLPSLPAQRKEQIFVGAGLVLGGNLLAMALLAPEIPGSRLPLMVLLLAYGSAALAMVSAAAFTSSFGRSFAVTSLLLLPLMATEILLEGSTLLEAASTPSLSQNGMAIAPQADSSGEYRAGSTWTSSYPDNARGYFEDSRTAEPEWQLTAHAPHASARLTVNAPTVTVHPDSIGTEIWHVQLRHPAPTQAGKDYEAHFRARASHRRLVRFFIAGSAADDQSVGMEGDWATVDTGWQDIRIPFRATRTDSGTFILDLGANAATLDVTPLIMVDRATGTPVKRPVTGAAGISFRFNSLGCRSPDRPLAKARHSVRVLALGDAYTLGAGVHARDTYAARLEAQLGGGSASRSDSTRYEVMNCGVTGSGVADAIPAFDRLAPSFAPDVVIIAVNSGDDRRRETDTPQPIATPPEHIERVFVTPWWFRARNRLQSNVIDTTGIVDGLAKLRDAVRARNAKLIVAVFEHPSASGLTTLERAVTAQFRNDSNAVVLTSSSLRAFAPHDLYVHPTLDHHPNDLAHRVLADALADVIRAGRSSGGSAKGP